YGLAADGIAGVRTWNTLYDVYRGIIESQPLSSFANTPVPFPGTFLVRGSEGDDVRLLQEYLNVIANVWKELTPFNITGYFGQATQNAVIAFQELYGIEPNGVVGPITWDAIASEANDITEGNLRAQGQYSGNFS
ncbi:MAG: peptidoglycan-binding protein, partial [Eubacteriales bacterium]